MHKLTLLFVLSSFFSVAQVDLVNLKNADMEIENLRFNVVQVRDARPDTMYIGKVFAGKFNKPKLAKLEGGNQNSIRDLLAFNFSGKGDPNFPVYLRIDHLEIIEGDFEVEEFALCKLTVSYFLTSDLSGRPYYTTSALIGDTILDVYPTHANRVYRAFKAVLIDFNTNGVDQEDYVPTANEARFDDAEAYVPVHVANENQQTQQKKLNEAAILDSTRKYRNNLPGGRNIIAIGYQIGGWTLVGAEFEWRLNNLLGISIGAGLTGATGGLKLHSSPSKNSLYFSPSFKDGGFGQLGSFCFEVGGRIPFKKKSYDGFGLQLQGGIQRVLYISEEFQQAQQELLGDSFIVGTIALSIGIGFSF